MAVAPPIYDPIGYYARAQLVLNALAKRDLHGVLNGPMSARPPGTAFVLYPFGFKASIHRFLFRSVFAPILIWVAALGIPIITRVSRRSDAILGSAVIVGLATMPLFRLRFPIMSGSSLMESGLPLAGLVCAAA